MWCPVAGNAQGSAFLFLLQGPTTDRWVQPPVEQQTARLKRAWPIPLRWPVTPPAGGGWVTSPPASAPAHGFFSFFLFCRTLVDVLREWSATPETGPLPPTWRRRRSASRDRHAMALANASLDLEPHVTNPSGVSSQPARAKEADVPRPRNSWLLPRGTRSCFGSRRAPQETISIESLRGHLLQAAATTISSAAMVGIAFAPPPSTASIISASQ